MQNSQQKTEVTKRLHRGPEHVFKITAALLCSGLISTLLPYENI